MWVSLGDNSGNGIVIEANNAGIGMWRGLLLLRIQVSEASFRYNCMGSEAGLPGSARGGFNDSG